MTTIIGNKKAEKFYNYEVNPRLAMHALRRDVDGNLIYTRIEMTSNESAILTNGQGPAYDGMDEFIGGVTPSGVVHNSVQYGTNEVGRKAFLGKDYSVSFTSNQKIYLDNNLVYEIDIVTGATYRFITENPTTQGYPLYISTQPYGQNYGNEYLQGVINSRSSYGGPASDINSNTTEPLTITVPEDAPSKLYLASGNHTNTYLTMHVNRLPHANLKNRYYYQVKWDDARVTYFINEDGFLVARYN